MQLIFVAVSLCAIFTNTWSLNIQEAGQFFNSRRFGGSVSIAERGESFIVTSNGLPDHATQLSGAILQRNNALTIPKQPEIAEFPGCLPMGPIGIAKSGVMLFHPLTDQGKNAVEGEYAEAVDACKGQVNSIGMYYYRQNSVGCLYKGEEDEFLGVAFDGFPIYGPLASDLEREVTNKDLDKCHGRLVNGQYRYHINNEFPYHVGCFKGIVQRQMDVLHTCNNTSEYDREWGYLCSCPRIRQPVPIGFIPNPNGPRQVIFRQPGQGIGLQGQIGNRMSITEGDLNNMRLLREQEILRIQQLQGQGQLRQVPITIRNQEGEIMQQPGQVVPGQRPIVVERERQQWIQGPFGERLQAGTITAGLPGFNPAITSDGQLPRPLATGLPSESPLRPEAQSPFAAGVPLNGRSRWVQGPFGERLAPGAITAGLPGFNPGAGVTDETKTNDEPTIGPLATGMPVEPRMVQGPFGERIAPEVVSAGMPGFVPGSGSVIGRPLPLANGGSITTENTEPQTIQGPFGEEILPGTVVAGMEGFNPASGVPIVNGQPQRPLAMGVPGFINNERRNQLTNNGIPLVMNRLPGRPRFVQGQIRQFPGLSNSPVIGPPLTDNRFQPRPFPTADRRLPSNVENVEGGVDKETELPQVLPIPETPTSDESQSVLNEMEPPRRVWGTPRPSFGGRALQARWRTNGDRIPMQRPGFGMRRQGRRPNADISEESPYGEYKWFNLYL